jgi:sigma-B regulation protein RsbU (phosphoserine phosphatase)
LGPKQSEEPFSATDLRLLHSVAAQTGLALENGRLTDAIKAEVRAREKQNRGLELGREVQERLFSQDYPSIAELDYAGACRPALGVVGDYYDFIPISNRGPGIAIGDVSGKGDSSSRLLRYVNPGHNAPMVIRTGNEVLRLDVGGSAVGLMREGPGSRNR